MADIKNFTMTGTTYTFMDTTARSDIGDINTEISALDKAVEYPMDRSKYNILNASIGDSGKVNSNNNCRTIWLNCLPNTTYHIKKPAGGRFRVSEYSGTSIATGDTTTVLVTDNAASEIVVTTGSSAKTLAAFVYYASTDSDTGDFAMINGTEVYQRYNPNIVVDNPFVMLDGSRSVYSGVNHPFRKFLGAPENSEASQGVIFHPNGFTYLFVHQKVIVFTAHGFSKEVSVTQFDHVQGVELLSSGAMLVTSSENYGSDQETRSAFWFDPETETVTDYFTPTLTSSLVYTSQIDSDNYWLVAWENDSAALHFYTYVRSTDTATEKWTYNLPRKYFQGACRIANLFYIQTNGASVNPPLIEIVDVSYKKKVGFIELRGFTEPEGMQVTCDARTGETLLHFVENVQNNIDTIYTAKITGAVTGTERVRTISGTTQSIMATPDTRYMLGTLSTLSFTPCESGSCEVVFTSGTSATVLTVPNTVKWPEWFDPTALETNRIYDIIITDATYGVVTSWET